MPELENPLRALEELMMPRFQRKRRLANMTKESLNLSTARTQNKTKRDDKVMYPCQVII